MPTFACKGAGYASTVEAASAVVAAWHHVSVAPRSPSRRIAYGAHVDVLVTEAGSGAEETVLVTNGSPAPEGAATARTLAAKKRRRPGR